MAIDFTKPVRTKGGRPVRIICTDRKSEAYGRVIGLMMLENGYERLMSWGEDGSSYGPNKYTLENVPVRNALYINVYPHTTSSHKTESVANESALGSRLALVQVTYNSDGTGVHVEKIK